MSDDNFDLFVIGGGSGGVRAARISATYGARVGICEEYRYGGTCVIRGCVPKKLLVYGSHFHEDFEDAAAYGWDVPAPTFDWSRLIRNKDVEIDRLNNVYHSLLEGAGCTLFHHRGVLKDAHTIQLGDREITAETILIATGGHPVKPEIPGIEHAITSNEAFHRENLPSHITVVGGGYIAVEFAGIFNGMGVDVTQLYRGEQILRGFDLDVRNHLAREIVKKGVDLRVGSNPARIDVAGDGYRVTLEDGSGFETGLVMYSTGRKPNTSGLGLEALGVELAGNGAVKVDEWSKTSVAHIYAVGDVTDRINLTPVALMEGHAFADTVYGGKPRTPDHEDVASAVFSQPSVATVGLPEHAARERYGAVDIYRSTFTPMKHTLSGRDEKTLMKLIVDQASDRVVGVHMVGPDAAELIQGIAIAIKCGATKAQFDATVGNHPTAGEEFVTMRGKVEPPRAEAAE